MRFIACAPPPLEWNHRAPIIGQPEVTGQSHLFERSVMNS
jgi:hypothetical protein